VPRSLKKHAEEPELSLLMAAIEASGDVVYAWDLATDHLTWSGHAARLFETAGEALPETAEGFHGLINPEDLPTRMHMLSAHMADEGCYDCEYRLRTEAGGLQWVHDRGAVERAPGGEPVRFLGVLRSVNQRKQYEARLEFLANFDELTGHYNKTRLREALDFAISQSLRNSHEGAFLVVGLDQTGMVNSAYGAEAGDAVLVEIGQRLDRALRGCDVIGRLGGDRFGVLLANSTEEGAVNAAERLLQIVRQVPIQFDGSQIHVTASVSIILFPSHSESSFDVMAKAEGCLIQAKSGGGDCASLYQMTQEQRDGYRASMTVGEEVKQALKDDRFTLAYQKVVSANGRQTAFCECLLRMLAPDGSIVPAGAFVPAVEQLGLMRTIDRRVLDLALRDLESHPEIALAVNISGLTASDHTWLRALIGKLRGRREIAERLIVEITETAALHDLEECARFVAAVRELGCKVAIDDFGAGYTSFQHLRTLSVDLVKIDGSFVRDVCDNPENQVFIRNLIGLAKALDLVTVAEFVETEREAGFLIDQGIDYLQGYLFGKPELTPAWKSPGALRSAEGEQRAPAITGQRLAG